MVCMGYGSLLQGNFLQCSTHVGKLVVVLGKIVPAESSVDDVHVIRNVNQRSGRHGAKQAIHKTPPTLP